jgi:cytidylate kinase
VVALDGPAASGKSTVAGLLAAELGFDHLDTGAMYRAVALAALNAGADVDDAEAVAAAAASSTIEIEGALVLLDGTDVSADIRTKAVSEAVSRIAVHSPVRLAMRELQRSWAASRTGVVAEGRDIGTVVFPWAQVKVFLTASPRVRAERRLGERSNGDDIDAVAAEIAERDERDANRADSPMRPAEDGVVFDTSHLSIDQVVDGLAQLVRDRVG